ncbi:glyoxalase [Streptomyces sp. NPDC101490]|uniref:glyoxalase n=1 Tax=Streptomyces sp. NPDC101490 TaxID=3366143 RepID=UPI00381E1423
MSAEVNVTGSTVVLDVVDPPASSRFFTTHLGYREVLAGEDFVVLARGDRAPDVLLRQRDLELPPARPVGVLVSFAVTGIAAEDERLRRERAHITVPLHREPWGARQLELTGPEGFVVQLVEWTAPAGA